MLPADNDLLKRKPKLTVQRGVYTYTIETHGDRSTYNVTDGTRTVSFPIHWSFGVGVQAWLLEKDGKFYESLVSYYPETDRLDLTVGDEGLHPNTLEEAAGRLITEPVLKDCFGCHASNAVVHDRLSLATAEPGVTCEHCHTGATAHLVSALQGRVDAPESLRKLSSEDMSTFCGKCHRTWETVVRNGWRGTANVRFAPYRLANSKCFDGTNSRISCVACHNPHEAVDQRTTAYDSKCLACHATTQGPAATRPAAISSVVQTAAPIASSVAKSCPVAKSDCVSCHMPKVSLPDEHVTFRDHWIRVVRPGDRYPD